MIKALVFYPLAKLHIICVLSQANGNIFSFPIMAVFGFCYVTRRYGFLEKRDIWRNGAVKVG